MLNYSTRVASARHRTLWVNRQFIDKGNECGIEFAISVQIRLPIAFKGAEMTGPRPVPETVSMCVRSVAAEDPAYDLSCRLEEDSVP